MLPLTLCKKSQWRSYDKHLGVHFRVTGSYQATQQAHRPALHPAEVSWLVPQACTPSFPGNPTNHNYNKNCAVKNNECHIY